MLNWNARKFKDYLSLIWTVQPDLSLRLIVSDNYKLHALQREYQQWRIINTTLVSPSLLAQKCLKRENKKAYDNTSYASAFWAVRSHFKTAKMSQQFLFLVLKAIFRQSMPDTPASTCSLGYGKRIIVVCWAEPDQSHCLSHSPPYVEYPSSPARHPAPN